MLNGYVKFSWSEDWILNLTEERGRELLGRIKGQQIGRSQINLWNRIMISNSMAE